MSSISGTHGLSRPVASTWNWDNNPFYDLGPHSSQGAGDTSSWWVPDRVLGFDMHRAALEHDKAWKSQSLTKRLMSNIQFRYNILKDTGNPVLAALYGAAVDIAALWKANIPGKLWGEAKHLVRHPIGAIKGWGRNMWGVARTLAKPVSKAVAHFVRHPIGALKSGARRVASEVKGFAKGAFNTAKKTVAVVHNSVKSAVKGAVRAVKRFFGF